MGDAHSSTLLPPSHGSFTPATPSGLTPNTRSEAEAALTLNSTTQTDSAAPTTPLASHGNMYPGMGAGGGNRLDGEVDDGTTEAQKAYRRPGPVRTSSTNYQQAVQQAHQEASASSTMSTETTTPTNITGRMTDSPTQESTPFPPPGQGVVPLHTSVGTGQAETVKKARPGLTLGMLGRQQSWNEQDMKHMHTAHLMAPPREDGGYSSGTEGTVPSPTYKRG